MSVKTELSVGGFPKPDASIQFSSGRNIWFAWAGGTQHGDPHYYRVQTASFLIEFDMTQDNANHIHSVWRDFGGDFGGDLLKAHYESSHGLEKA